jgi:hypothetical protein
MSIRAIYPYRLGSCWVFDDPRTGLKEEAFVLGSSEVFTQLVEAKRIQNATQGFVLHFGDEPFEGFDAELTWQRSATAEIMPGIAGSASQIFGNWYRGRVGGKEMEGWLCPALGLYFTTAPARIFVSGSGGFATFAFGSVR